MGMLHTRQYIQDAPDFDYQLKPSDNGRLVTVLDGKFIVSDFPKIEIPQSYYVGARLRIQSALDGPSELNSASQGKVLTYDDVTKKFVVTAQSALDAGTLGGHSASYFLAASTYTAADVLSKLTGVDGSGSTLDADTLDGIDSLGFVKADGTITGASSQVQTFTNGTKQTSIAPLLDATGIDLTSVAGTSIVHVDPTNLFVGINTTTPIAALHVINNTVAVAGAVAVCNNMTDATNKFGRFIVPHFTNAEEPLVAFSATNTSTLGQVDFGGGSSIFNTATVIRFFTANDTITLTGSERLRVTKTGLIGIGNTAPTNLLGITGVTTPPGTVSTVASTTLTGTNTTFTNTFRIGDTVTVSGETARTISVIASDTSLTVTSAFSNTASTLSYTATGGTRLEVRANGNIGLGTATPTSRLQISGASSGAAWGVAGLVTQIVAATYTDATTANSATVATAVFNSYGIPTLATIGTSVTYSDVATVYIAGAPAVGTNTPTLTRSMGLWVKGGSKFEGNIGFFAVAPAAQQTSGANLTNNVTSGGSNDTIANYTDLSTYANDAAAIRNNIYQLSRKLKQVNDALRLYGLLT